jgi:hypothetical protein
VQALYVFRDRALSVVQEAGGSSQVLYGLELTIIELIQTFWSRSSQALMKEEADEIDACRRSSKVPKLN